ncbi:MAG: hypothetical protein ACLUFN_08920 [Eubacterium sp.]
MKDKYLKPLCYFENFKTVDVITTSTADENGDIRDDDNVVPWEW